MDSLRTYLLSLILTSLMGTVLTELLREGTVKSLLKALWGLVLGLQILSPLADFTPELSLTLPDLRQEAASAAARGEALASDALREVICTDAEAYIQDKGAALGADLQPEVIVNDAPVPVSVTVRGTFTREQMTALQELIRQQLGIPKEDQTWIP